MRRSRGVFKETAEAVQKVRNTVYSWNARQTAVQRPRSQATVLTFCSKTTVLGHALPGVPPSKKPIYLFDPVEQSLRTLVFKAKRN